MGGRGGPASCCSPYRHQGQLLEASQPPSPGASASQALPTLKAVGEVPGWLQGPSTQPPPSGTPEGQA